MSVSLNKLLFAINNFLIRCSFFFFLRYRIITFIEQKTIIDFR